MASGHANVNEIEGSFQGCISALLGQTNDEKGNPTGADCAIKKFLEDARSLETFFLQKQLTSRVAHPQESVKEEVIHLRNELTSKDEVISNVAAKVNYWTTVLDELQRVQKGLSSTDEHIPNNVQQQLVQLQKLSQGTQ